jgi:aryl-alcohol dehydrogenase-like predicted oxidoreductase
MWGRLLLTISLWGCRALAFQPAAFRSLAHSARKMSSTEDDALSKLITKRGQIKRKKFEEIEEPLPPEPVVDLDLDKLPQFKVDRPNRVAEEEDGKKKKKKKKDKDGDDKDEKKPADAPIVDFKADYEDENDFHIPNRIGISTKNWGNPSAGFVASGKLTKRMVKAGKFVPGDLQLAHTKLLEGGVTFIETSPVYGAAMENSKLSAELILQRCISEQGGELPENMVMENLGVSSWKKLLPKRITQSLYDSVETLETPIVQLFQVPKSFLYPSILLANALAAAIESGCCNYVGVEGVTNGGKLRKLSDLLDARDVQLTTNAFEFSLTSRKNEKMFDICKALGVTPLVTNPLDGGLASGVYTATNPSGGEAGAMAKFSFKQLDKLQPLHSVQESVVDRVRTRVIRDMRNLQDRVKGKYGPPAKINTDITTTQIAINYVIAKGGVPLVEVDSPRMAEEVVGSLGWTLTDEEVDLLDAAAALCDL